MTAMTREPEAPDTLLRDFLSLDIPEGYRAQLIDGEIVVTPPPAVTTSAASRGSSSKFSPAALRAWISQPTRA